MVRAIFVSIAAVRETKNASRNSRFTMTICSSFSHSLLSTKLSMSIGRLLLEKLRVGLIIGDRNFVGIFLGLPKNTMA